jgi:Ca2+-dependent lipid-binding protein
MKILWIKCVKAKDLKSADANGFSDPYCVFQLGAAKCKTKTVKKSLNPCWNEMLQFGEPSVGNIKVTVMDWDRVGKDDFLGEFTIEASLLSNDVTLERW